MARRPRDEEIARMFERAAWVDGLAVVTGPVSGSLCVRDFDDPDGYISWANEHRSLAERLPTVRTGRGYHVYFRLPRGHEPVYRKWRDGPQKGELLGDGRHYVVAPPSRHPSGNDYRWLWAEPFSRDDVPVLTTRQFEHLIQGSPPQTTNSTPHRALRVNTSSVARIGVRVLEERSKEVLERDAVMQCLPTGPGQRNDCLWALARTLKALPHLAEADGDDLRPHFDLWYGLAERVIETKSEKVCWSDFLRQWKLVRVPAGEGFERAMATALARPFPPEAERYKDEETRRLVAVCAALQSFAGNDVFYISYRTAQRLCGYGSYHTAGRRLMQLVDVGLLALVERGKGGTSRRRASRYRWLGSAQTASATAAVPVEAEAALAV